MPLYICVYDKTSYMFSQEMFAQITAYIDEKDIAVCYDPLSPLARRRSEKTRRPMLPTAAMADSALPEGLEEYLRGATDGFAMTLFKRIDAKGMNDAACCKKANKD